MMLLNGVAYALMLVLLAVAAGVAGFFLGVMVERRRQHRERRDDT